VFEYCGWDYTCRHLGLDANDMIAAMNLMVEKGGKGKRSQFSEFMWFCHGHCLNENPDIYQSDFIAWLFQPDRFFTLFGAWLEKEGK